MIMKLLRKLFFLQTVYSKQTPDQIIKLICILFIIWPFLFLYTQTYMPSYMPLTIIFSCVITSYILMRIVLQIVIVNRYIKVYGDSVLLTRVRPPHEVNQASINNELKKIDSLEPIAAYKNARMFLATFSFYKAEGRNIFSEKHNYYLVLEVQLKRYLPHILFDSKLAKKSQFKSIYLQAQKISIQGSFDDVFTTYVPQTYHIDTLSFITPEVMEALLAVRAYDIEIINDKLLLYAPLLDKKEMETFATQGRALAAHINDNVDTYRDDRLTGVERKTIVTPFARTLLKSPFIYLLFTGLFGSMIALIVTYSLVHIHNNGLSILVMNFSLYVYAFFIGNSVLAIKIIRENKRVIKNYQKRYTTKPIKSSVV